MSGKKDTIHLQDLESHVRDEDENSKYKPLPLDKIFLTGKKWFQNELDKIFMQNDKDKNTLSTDLKMLYARTTLMSCVICLNWLF